MNKSNIEAELRSFITREQYDSLYDRFLLEGKFLGEDEQITYYFSGEKDLRIQKNNYEAKIILKAGRVHDEQREELEIPCDAKEFFKLEALFLSLGYTIDIKWFRTRKSFTWRDTSVALDNTKGYGYILELEILSNEEEKDHALHILYSSMKELEIEITTRELFDEKYSYYQKNWKEILDKE